MISLGTNITALTAAILAGKEVEIDYTDVGGEKTTRTIKPESLTLNKSDSEVRAYCNLRRAVRSFKVDRISDVREYKPKPKLTIKVGEYLQVRGYGSLSTLRLVHCGGRKVVFTCVDTYTDAPHHGPAFEWSYGMTLTDDDLRKHFDSSYEIVGKVKASYTFTPVDA